MNTSQQGIKRLFWAGVGTAAMVLAGCATTKMDPGSTVTVMLIGAREVPALNIATSGSGTFTVGADKSVSGSVTTYGVVGTAAHIHVGAYGNNGPVAIGLTKTANTTWSVPAGAKFTDEQYQAYKAGETYVNVHSAAHKGGEVRDQLRP